MAAMTTSRNARSEPTNRMWEAVRAATARSETALSEGPDSDRTPAGLLTTAAGASLQSTFLEIADDAQLPILGYVAQQHPDLDPRTHEVSQIVLSACISVPTHHAEKAARAAWKLAVDRAPILRALGRVVHAEPSIIVLSDRATPDGSITT